MRYTVVVVLDTDRTPQNLLNEVVSTLEFDAATKTVVESAVALADGKDAAIYDRDAPNAAPAPNR